MSISIGNTFLQERESQNMNFLTSDHIRIGGPGGFVGKFGDMKIYHPGSAYVGPSCGSSSSCPFQIGVGLFSDCLSNQCDTDCEVCGGANRCALCKEPSYLYNYQCVTSCNTRDGQYKVGNYCYDCHESCITCSGPEVCLPCTKGSRVFGSSCEDEESGDGETEKMSTFYWNINKLVSPVVNLAKLIYAGPSSINAEIILDMFHNIKFYNITYSDQLQTVLYNWDPLTDPLFDFQQFPESLESSFPQEPLPKVFEKYDLPSSFLINYWNCLILITAFFITFLLSKLGVWVAAKYPRKTILLYWCKKIRIRMQNFVLAYAIGAFGEFLFCASIGYQTTNLAELVGPYISFIISSICSILFTGLFFYNLSFLLKFQLLQRKIFNKKTDENVLERFKSSHEGFAVFFGDFNIGFWQQSFLPIMMIREISFYSSLTFLSNSPLIQVVLTLFWIIGMILYQIIQRPFDSKFEAFQHFFYEINLLIVNVCLWKTISLGETETETKENIGQFLLILNIVFSFLVMVFLLISIFGAIYEEYKEFRRVTKRNKIHPESDKTPTETDSSPTERKAMIKKTRSNADLPTAIPPENDSPTHINPIRPQVINIEKVQMTETEEDLLKKETSKKEVMFLEHKSPTARISRLRNLQRKFRKLLN